MNVADIREEYDHPAWFTAVGTFLGYGVVLTAMAVVLFGIPWLLFHLL